MQTFEFYVDDLKDELLLKFVDDEMSGERAIGLCNIKFSSLCINGGEEQTHAIWYGQQEVGSVTIISDYVPYCMQQISLDTGDKSGKVHEELERMTVENNQKEQEKNAIIKRKEKLL